VKLSIAPGENLMSTLKGPSRKYVFNNFQTETSGSTLGAIKGHTVFTLIKLVYDTQIFDRVSGSTAFNWVPTNHSNLGPAASPENNKIYAPVIVTYKKYFKMLSPPVTGGSVVTATANVQLNNMKDVYCFHQPLQIYHSATPNNAKLTYKIDEESPKDAYQAADGVVQNNAANFL